MAYERTYGPPARAPIPDVRQPFYDGTDFVKQAGNNRQRSVAQGDMMNQELQDFGNDEDYWRQYYRGEGNSAYGDIAAGRGGYSEAERNDIIGKGGLDALAMTPEQRQALNLTDAEQVGMYGDPNKGAQWFNPGQLNDINTESNQRVWENVGDSQRDLNNTYDEDALSLSKGYKDELGNAVQGGAANVRSAINRDRLTLDPNFLRDYRMSDRDVNDMTQQAALDQGQVSRGRMDAITRSAAGSGMSPLALAASMNELTTRGDQQANRAMIDARIAARNAQADRLRTSEGMRLDAEGNYAGMSADAEMALGDRAYGAARDYEGQRLGSEQDKQSRQYQIAANNADRSYNATNQTNNNSMDNARYVGETGAALYNAADQNAVARSRDIALNRQGVEAGAQDTNYARGQYANDAVSKRTQTAADARLAQEKEYRAWLAGQQGQANENTQTAYANRLKNYAQTADAAQGSTGQAMQYQLGKDSNGFGANFKRSLGSSLGSFIGNPIKAVGDYNKAANGGG